MHKQRAFPVVVTMYISTQFVNMGYLMIQYRAALPSNVQKILSFVDLVPLFRKLGGDILEKQMHLIKVDLMAVSSYPSLMHAIFYFDYG